MKMYYVEDLEFHSEVYRADVKIDNNCVIRFEAERGYLDLVILHTDKICYRVQILL